MSFRKFIFLLLAFAYLASYSQRKREIDSLEFAFKNCKDDKTKVLLYEALSKLHGKNDQVKGLKLAEEGLVFAKKINYEVGEAHMMEAFASNYFNSKPVLSKEYFDKARVIYNRHNEKAREGYVTGAVGSCLMKEGNYKAASEAYLTSLNLLEKYGDKKEMGQMLNNMMALNIYIGNYNEALNYGYRSLKLKKEIGDIPGLASIYGNIGTCFYNMGQHDSSLANNLRAIEIRKSLNDIDGLALSCNNIAGDYAQRNDYRKAAKYLGLAKNAYEHNGDLAGLTLCLTNMAELQALQGEFGAALTNCNRGLKIAKEIESLDDTKNALKVLSGIQEKMGKHKDALISFKEYTTIKDSLGDIERGNNIMEIQAKFESEKKEEQIKVLEKNKKIQELELTNKEENIRQHRIILFFISGGFAIVIILSFFIFKSYREKKKANIIISLQKQEVEKAKELVEEKQKEIIDSILYAKRIQQSLMPTEKYIERNLKK